jgi:type IV pilus assembly protein PilY1
MTLFNGKSRQILSTILASLAFCLGVSALVQAQPATEPLLTRAAAVRPNLLFILDNSGSMSDENVEAPHYNAATGSCSDTAKYRDSTPVNNLLYYNSTKRYEPAYNNSGVQLANAAVPSSWSNLTIYLPKTGQNIPALTTKSDICTASRYDTIVVRNTDFTVNGVATTTNPLPWNANRTDCGAGPCTLAQEKQNISNWRTFHRSKFAAAKTGLGKAFDGQPDTFRLGYTSIHVSAIDGSGSDPYKLNGVKDFNLAKTEFYTWLNGLSQVSGTPLRQALGRAGDYYRRNDKNGPWAHSPWKTNSEGEATSDHLSCRRSYTILISDGEWNGNAAPLAAAQADVDSTTGPNITHTNGITSYTYVPRSSDPRSRGKADRIVAGAGYGNTLSDVALYYWMNDLRGAGNVPLANNVTPGRATDKPFWQNMITYTAGFGVAGKLNATQLASARAGTLNWYSADPAGGDIPTRIDDLIHAAHNGGGEYLSLANAQDFAAEIGRVVGSIAGEQFSQAGVAASAVALTAGTKKFVPYFTSNLWWGNVRMINLSSNVSTLGDEVDVAWDVVQTDPLGKPTGVTKIPSHSARNIHTWINGVTGGMPFTWSTITGQSLRAAGTSTSALSLNSGFTSDMVDFIRGRRDQEGEGQPYRARETILGDIVNSTPVFVKNNSNFRYESLPSSVPGASTYSFYMQTKAQRAEGVLFIGANDGMLHGFREGSTLTNGGEEVFAFVPRGVFKDLHELANKSYAHRFYVDGPLSESDAYINAPNFSGTGKSVRWTNLVLGTTGAGGRSVFALDVTRPLAMNQRHVLWEIHPEMGTDYQDIGFVMSEVQTGITRSGDWVAIFGNGPYGNSGRAHLYVVNLATGTLIKKINTDSATSNGLGGVRVVRDANSRIIGAYAGDLLGRVWRFDLSDPLVANWPNANKLFTATGPTNLPQPITATPGVVPRTDGQTGYIVTVGTGKLYDSNDQSNVQPQSAYGLWDKASFGSTSVTFSEITTKTLLVSVAVVTETANVTTTSSINPNVATTYYKTNPSRAVNWSFDRGWFINYTQTPGQRTIYGIEPVGEVMRIDTIAPRLAQFSCEASTSLGFNYLVSPLTGTCKSETTLDTNNDGVIDQSDSVACIYSTEADGEDVVLEIRDDQNQWIGLVDIQDSAGHIKARVFSPPPPCTGPGCCTGPSCGATGIIRRDWRQIFLRQN